MTMRTDFYYYNNTMQYALVEIVSMDLFKTGEKSVPQVIK